MRILIADDDPVSRAVLAKIAGTRATGKVVIAEDGETAWQLLDDPGRSFDVLFLDLEMPKLGGFELLEKIRSSPLLKTLQVVLVTASHDRGTVVKAAQLGVRHFLAKPCTEPVVLAKLDQLKAAHA